MATGPEVTGPVNLGNPGEFTIRELAEKIVHLTGAEGKRWEINLWNPETSDTITRTGLFDSLEGRSGLTSSELAGAAGLNERYVREWLAAMVAGLLPDDRH